MKRKSVISRAFIVILYLCTVTFVTFPANTNAQQTYPIRVDDPEGLRIISARAVVSGNELIVSGKIRRSALYTGTVPPVIMVSIVDASGKIISSKKISYSPGRLSPRRHAEARFAAGFSVIPGSGAVVYISGPR